MREAAQRVHSGRRLFDQVAIALLLTTILACGSQAAYLREVPQTLIQPDGTVVQCLASGDEYYHRLHDAEGYTIVQDPESGRFVYAMKQGDRLVASSHVAGRVDPAAAGLTPRLRISEEDYRARVAFRRSGLQPKDGLPRWMPTTGQMNNIVIFIRFSDETEFGESISTYDDWFNDSTDGANSMFRYFREASYEQLEITTTLYPAAEGGMVVSYQDGQPRAYYQPRSGTNAVGYVGDVQAMQREFSLLKSAVEAVGPAVPPELDLDLNDDGYVDNVCFIVRGDPDGWSDLLWPHMWQLYDESYATYINGDQVWTFNFQLQNTLSSPSVGVGVLCHEMFHSLGAPDLYHYSEGSQNLEPIGRWGLMEWNLNPPQHMGAYMKFRYGGWIPELPEISADGTYTLQPLTSSSSNCYKIPSPSSGSEFFVVEYRKTTTSMFEENLPGSGLLVYRINTAKDGEGNAQGPPDEVYIYRPGGTTTANGTIDEANFSTDVGRTEINDSTDPSSFLSNGSDGGLDIRAIGVSGSTIQFQIGEGGGGACATSLGDANGDAAVNVLDLVSTVNHILDTEPLGEGGEACADANEDSAVDILDVVAIVNIILEGKRPARVQDRFAAAADPVAWSAERSGSLYRLSLDGNRLGGLQVTLAMPEGERLSGAPLLRGGRPGATLSWLEREGRCTILAYRPTGGPLSDGWLELELTLEPTPGRAGAVEMPEPAELLLVSPEGRRLRPAEGPPRPASSREGAVVRLIAVRPSPTTGPAEIVLDLPRGGTVLVGVFDPSGRLVRTVREGRLDAGRHRLVWDGSDDRGEKVATGIYFVGVQTASSRDSRSILVMR